MLRCQCRSAALVAAVINFAAEIEHVEQIADRRAPCRLLWRQIEQLRGSARAAGRIRYHLAPLGRLCLKRGEITGRR
jgi:hypothetical protein